MPSAAAQSHQRGLQCHHLPCAAAAPLAGTSRRIFAGLQLARSALGEAAPPTEPAETHRPLGRIFQGLHCFPAHQPATGFGPAEGGSVEAASAMDHHGPLDAEATAGSIGQSVQSRSKPGHNRSLWASGTSGLTSGPSRLNHRAHAQAAGAQRSQGPPRAGCRARASQLGGNPTAGKAPITALGRSFEVETRVFEHSRGAPTFPGPYGTAICRCWRR